MYNVYTAIMSIKRDIFLITFDTDEVMYYNNTFINKQNMSKTKNFYTIQITV